MNNGEQKFKQIGITLIFLNIFAISFVFIYLYYDLDSLLSNLLGILPVITIYLDLYYIFITSKNVSKFANRGVITKSNYIFCSISIIFLFLILFLNALKATPISNNAYFNRILSFLIICFYLGVYIIFLVFSAFIILNHTLFRSSNKPIKANSKYEVYQKLYKSFVKLFEKIVFIVYIISLIFCACTLFGSFEIVTFLIVVLASQFGIFWSIILFGNTLVLLNLKFKKWNSKKIKIFKVIGICISIILLIPVFSIPNSVENGKKSFSDAFGSDWEKNIPSEISAQLLSTPFNLNYYFFGMPAMNCEIKTDILYYENSSKGLKLYFNMYLPPRERGDLYGNHSVLIRIHGGAWIIGDKGPLSMMLMNKYFASKGFIVFDIQYPLFETYLSVLDPITPKNNLGNYSIDDMVYYIGLFTKFLENYPIEYQANLNSVFISGGSSGGHLASILALAMTKGNNTDLFSSKITIKGYIPFYPANGLMSFIGVESREEYKNPVSLIDSSSPPCLIFQGTHDIINYFYDINQYKQKYSTYNRSDCAIVWLNWGGHAFDFYFPGYYNQVCIYFMERFMYLYR